MSRAAVVPRQHRALWAGRAVALLGILLLALSLRAAVAAISPISAQIAVDIPLSGVGLGVIGALPPVFFALAGFMGPRVARRLGIELSLLLSVLAIVVGHLARALAGSYVLLLLGSALTFAGMGIANVLLPPAVKRYFPDRIAALTAIYVTLLTMSAALPAISAVPVADAFGWRASLGLWSFIAAIAVVPWFILLSRQRSADTADAALIVEAPPALLGAMWRSRVAWGIAITFSISGVISYALFAWMPELLVETADVSAATAGSLLGLFSLVGVPGSILAPLLVVRLRHPGWVVHSGALLFFAGLLGLLLAPAANWFWVILLGFGAVLFPVALVLVNARTRSHQASAALSGFVQGVGYSLAAVGTFAIGALHDMTGSWAVPLLLLCLVALSGIPAGYILRRPRFVEDDLGVAS